MSKVIADVIENTKDIFMTDSSLTTLLDFERVMDELDNGNKLGITFKTKP